jgi:hypothetical protein
MQPLDGWKGIPSRIVIHKEKVDADLTDFLLTIYKEPHLVNINFNLNRKKFAVTLEDGVTQCFAEARRESVLEEPKLIVKVPKVLCNADTILYLYYDPTHEDNNKYIGDPGSETAKNVWAPFITVCSVGTANEAYTRGAPVLSPAHHP